MRNRVVAKDNVTVHTVYIYIHVHFNNTHTHTYIYTLMYYVHLCIHNMCIYTAVAAAVYVRADALI